MFNVPKARSQGLEVEFEAAPNRNINFAVSTSFNDAKLRSDVPPIDVTGIRLLGSGAAGPLAQVFLGTAASKILRHAPVPVMILPRQHTSPKE